MEILRADPKIGNFMMSRVLRWACALSCLFAQASAWSAVSFRASTDSQSLTTEQTVSIEDSVQIIFQLETDQEGGHLDGLQANIDPSFELLNEFSSFSSETTQGFSGPSEVRNIQQITRIYKPTRLGTFVFSNIQARVNGKMLPASRNITIHVVGAQAGGGGASRSGSPGSPKVGGGTLSGMSRSSTKIPIQLRAEVNKTTAYKGEQIIVSYWFYRRVRTAGIQVDQYPTLPGFLREELEMPVLSPRRESEQVVIGGVPYTRSLLVRYAAYPLEEGKLRVDPMTLKYQYFSADAMGGIGQAWEDLGLSDDSIFNFFRKSLPKAGQVKSDPIVIESIPLPIAGRPDSFTGGVGDFSVSASVSSAEVRANEPLTLTLQVAGQGNLAAIAAPQVKWPAELELYDTQIKVKAEKGGRGEKTFEFLIIPRKPGHFKLPSIDLGFFDPGAKSYVTRTTPGFEITVKEGAPGASAPVSSKRVNSNARGSEESSGAVAAFLNDPRTIRALLILFAVLAGGFAVVAAGNLWRKKRRESQSRRSREDQPVSSRKEWEALKKTCQGAVRDLPWAEVTAAYEQLAGLLFDALDREIKNWSGSSELTLRSRSRSRNDLHSFLVQELRLPEEIWVNFSKILEFSELVRFASAAGAVSEAQARKDLTHWVLEGQRWVQALETIRKKSR